MDDRLLLDTAVLAGTVMLESGAETYRVEDTMKHILGAAKESESEVFAMTTGIVATIGKEGADPITRVKRISERNTNLGHIVQVNDISRRFCGGKITLAEASGEMRCLKKNNYPAFLYRPATVGVVLGFVVMLGGNAVDAAIGTAVGAALAFASAFAEKAGWNAFIRDMAGCAVVSFFTYLLREILPFGFHTNLVVTGAIMPLVPGVAITNAVRDSLQGDFLSGGARIMEAFLKAVAIAIGIGVGMLVFKTTM